MICFSATHGIWCFFEALKFMLLDLKYLIAVVESTQPQIGLESSRGVDAFFFCVSFKDGFRWPFPNNEWIEAFAK